MIPLPDPVCRTLPVDLPALAVSRLISGRIRMVLLPGRREAALSPGDCLWVREQFRVFPSGPGLVDVLYGAERVRGRRWPSALRQPAAGLHLAEAMPVHLSRLTLVVVAARTIRLQQITEDEAVAAGVTINPHGHGHLWAPDADWPSAVEAFGRMWNIWPGRLERDLWTVNAEVRALSIRAVARNIADLVPGIGQGGVR